MLTYYVTFLAVALFAGLSQYTDYERDGSLCYGPVKHSLPSWVFFLVTLLVLVCVAGFRYQVGADFGGYYEIYNDQDELVERWTTLDEPGYYTLAFIMAQLFHSKLATTFCSAAITITLFAFTAYRNSDQIFVTCVLLLFICWDGCFNGVRQYLATAIVFAGLPFLRDKKLLPYLIVVGIAFLFHRSAVIMVFVYPVAQMKIDAKNILLFLGCSIAVLVSFDFVLRFTGWLLESSADSFNDTTDSYITSSVNILRTAAGVAPAAAALVFFWRKEKDEKTTFNMNLLNANAILRIASAGSTYVARAAIFTSPFLIVAIPELLKLVPARYRAAITVAILFLYGFMWWYEIQGSSSLNHWQWVWNA